jgi:CheY-like chemotaxis protein
MRAMTTAWLPFFHPTRVVFVDDHASVFHSLFQDMAHLGPVSVYESGPSLLDDIRDGKLPTGLWLDCFNDYSGVLCDEELERVVGLDRTMIVKRLFTPERFSTMGVAVVDYSMPDLDGLSLCRELQAHADRFGYTAAKRIMLTAQADMALGVDALNEGVIDAFYRKDLPDLAQVLAAKIRVLQHAFIAEATDGLRGIWNWDDPTLARSAGFKEWFADFCKRRGVVEYYAVFAPGRGLLMLDGNGVASLLLLFSEDEVASQYDAARTACAPADVLDGLKRRTHGLYFDDELGTQVMDGDGWRRACVALHPFPERYDQFYALPDHCHPHGLGIERVTSLHRTLELNAQAVIAPSLELNRSVRELSDGDTQVRR